MINNHQFALACQLQAEHFRNSGSFGTECNRVLYRAASEAAVAVIDGHHCARVHLVPAGTGTGKTTFSLSLIAACCLTRDAYTAAFATPTISAARQVYEMLSCMLPSNMLAIHTSAHACQAEAKKFGG